jgi:hypothetical protein
MNPPPVLREARGDAATVLGIMNAMAALGYAGLAVYAVAAGVSWLGTHEGDPWWPLASLFGLLPALVIAFGVLAAAVALVALLAAVGVLRGRTWGWVLTCIVAVVAILLGLLWTGGSDLEPFDLAIGGVQLIYGILAFVVLAVRGRS